MKYIDISWPLSTATTGYKDKNIVAFEPTKHFDADGARETKITLSTHSGTHVDAPAHFIREGKTVDELPLDRCIGRCVVLDMTGVLDAITRERLQEHDIKHGECVLLKTVNSDQSPTQKFSPHFVYLAESGALYLKEKKVKAVGIDYLGIERSQSGHQTHLTLMHADIAIIEGLRLQHVPAGRYQLICLPLYLVGVEAAPARAILITDEQ